MPRNGRLAPPPINYTSSSKGGNLGFTQMGQVDSARNDAHHEAGHAVAAVVYDIGLVSVDIRPQRVPGGGIGRGGANFEMFPENEIFGQGEEAVMPYLITFFAGVFGEQQVNPAAGLETGLNPDGFRV